MPLSLMIVLLVLSIHLVLNAAIMFQLAPAAMTLERVPTLTFVLSGLWCVLLAWWCVAIWRADFRGLRILNIGLWIELEGRERYQEPFPKGPRKVSRGRERCQEPFPKNSHTARPNDQRFQLETAHCAAHHAEHDGKYIAENPILSEQPWALT